MAARKTATYHRGKVVAPGTLWVATWIEWSTEEDSYEEGEIGNGATVLDEKTNHRAKTPAKLLQKLASAYGVPSNRDAWSAVDKTIECQFTVDEDNTEATKSQIDAWKKGARRLWTARVRVGVEKVVIYHPSTTELAHEFGIEDVGDIN